MPTMTRAMLWKMILPIAAFGAPFMAAAQTAPAGAPQAALVEYRVVGDGIPASLTGNAGDPLAGRKVIEDRKLGNCLSCHAFPFSADDPGNIGPDLRGVVGRMTPAQFRLRLVNMKVLDPQTIMPAYYRIAGLRDVSKSFAGKPILTAQQVEDVVAYLASTTSTGANR